MLKNYLTVAIRGFSRSRIYAIINILGLALGMASRIAILVWVWDERGVDAFHSNGGELYSVYERRFVEGVIEGSRETPGPACR